MKAIVVSEFGPESVLHYVDAPVPEPKEGEVLVRMEAVGVNPVDTYIRSGAYGAVPSLPYTPGEDGAGVIDKVGPGVQGVSPGDRVWVAAAYAKRSTGSYAEFMACDAEATQPLPDSISFSEGAGLGIPGQAAASALFTRAKMKPGETVLVHGATGGVGTLAVQLARRSGAKVVGTAGSEEGLKVVRDLGAHHVFNHHDQDYMQKIAGAVSPGGIDVVVEMLANVNLAKDLSLIAKNGRIVIVGSRGSVDFNPRDTMAKNAAIFGMLVKNMSYEQYRMNMFRLKAGLETGLKVLVGGELPLEHASVAHQRVLGDKQPGKIVLRP
jgi:NADPH:quinone reductase and related Zn-dependent oxidoreductases